jgi:diguanylate cyclase (GGDEF)-like protein
VAVPRSGSPFTVKVARADADEGRVRTSRLWPHASRRGALNVLLLVAVTSALLHVAVLLPVFGARPGQFPVFDGVSDFVGAATAAVMLWVRGGGERPEQRLMWRILGAAVFCYLTGSLLSLAAHAGLLGPLGMLPAATGWGLFYLLAYAAIVHLLRQRVRRFHASMWFDGLICGLAVAAVTVAFLLTPVSRALGGDITLLLQALVMPVADILLLVLLSGVFAVIWRTVSRDVMALAAGMVVFVVTDLVFALTLSRGQYVDGGPVDLGWVLAQLCLAVAAWLPSRHGVAVRFGGVSVLVIPSVAAAGAIAILFLATWRPVSPAAQQLALLAVTAVLARTALTFREIRALADSRREARTDDLTGLPNLRRLLEELARVSVPAGSDAHAAVLLLNLDGFTEINDLYGHGAGDRVLQGIAERIAQSLSPQDFVARTEGDTFVVLAQGLRAETQAVELAQRLRTRIGQPWPLGNATRQIHATVGIATTDAHTGAGTDLLKMADLAMHAAKRRRTGVLVYDHGRDGQGRRRAETIDQLRTGIDRGELRLHYQPQLDLRTNRVTGVEALVRWQHPTRGLLYPDSFVDLAENAGLMPQLTRAVLDLSLAQSRRWSEAGLRLHVAVNISASDLADETLPVLVDVLLHQHQVPAAELVIEVTEGLLITDRDSAAAVLDRLARTGVRVAIDDYGTGYSNLVYLADLPVDELKLDRALVSTVATNPRTRAIVASTTQLAHTLGLTVTAEGIEDSATLDLLTREGCDLGQGYHIGRPLPPEQLTRLLIPLGDGTAALADAGRTSR